MPRLVMFAATPWITLRLIAIKPSLGGKFAVPVGRRDSAVHEEIAAGEPPRADVEDRTKAPPASRITATATKPAL